MRPSKEQRLLAIGRLQAGDTVANVANFLGVSMRTVRRLRAKYAATGSVEDLPRSGRPRETTLRQDRHIILTHLRNRFTVPRRTAINTPGRTHPHISARTVSRRLRTAGLRCRRPYIGPRLTNAHRRRRLNWATQYQRWLLNQWNSVMFSDESRFAIDSSDRRNRVYRRVGERFADPCVLQSNRWGGASTMVWGGFMGRHKSRLVFLDFRRGGLTAQRYINNVLQPVVLPFIQQHPGAIFQQDNARPHSARVTTNFLAANNVNTLPWPSLSADMNPMEHVWDYVKRKVRERNVQNVQQLQAAITHEWNQIPALFLLRLTASMRRRCTAVVNARGGHTRY